MSFSERKGLLEMASWGESTLLVAAAAAAAAIGGMEKRICCMVVQLRLARSPIITIPLPSLGSHSAWSPVCYAFAWE